MPSDSSGTQVYGIVVDKNNLLYLPKSPVFTGGEQLDAAAGVSFGSNRCAQQHSTVHNVVQNALEPLKHSKTQY